MMKALPGPPKGLISRIDHLATLFCNLPSSISFDPPVSKYYFALDPEKLEDCGTFGAFTDCMEISFETYHAKSHVIHFVERGKQLEGLMALMKTEHGDLFRNLSC